MGIRYDPSDLNDAAASSDFVQQDRQALCAVISHSKLVSAYIPESKALERCSLSHINFRYSTTIADKALLYVLIDPCK